MKRLKHYNNHNVFYAMLLDFFLDLARKQVAGNEDMNNSFW